jgi:hypothetical protein
MAAFFASGQVATVILVGMVLEGCALAAWHWRTGRGVAPGDFLANLVSGMFLLLAMRLALGGAWFGWVGACLLGALAGHATELRRRWRG